MCTRLKAEVWSFERDAYFYSFQGSCAFPCESERLVDHLCWKFNVHKQEWLKLYKFRVAPEFISVSRKGSQTSSRSRGWFIALLDSGPPQQFRLFFHCFRSRQDVRSWLGLRMEKNPLSSAKLGPPPGPGSFLWASPSLFDRHRTGWWRERRVWEQINCHLTEIPSSIVAAFPISKECAPVRTVQAVQAVLGTVQTEGINGDPRWLSSVCPWSIDPDPDSSAAIKL